MSSCFFFFFSSSSASPFPNRPRRKPKTGTNNSSPPPIQNAQQPLQNAIKLPDPLQQPAPNPPTNPFPHRPQLPLQPLLLPISCFRTLNLHLDPPKPLTQRPDPLLLPLFFRLPRPQLLRPPGHPLPFLPHLHPLGLHLGLVARGPLGARFEREAVLDRGREVEEAGLELGAEGEEGEAFALERARIIGGGGGGGADVLNGGFDVFAAELGEDVDCVGVGAVVEFGECLVGGGVGVGVGVFGFGFGFGFFGDGGEGGGVG